jgi:pyridoxal phosphate-dependent aminotransferase EpsN
VRALDAQGIDARPIWRPMHTQPMFRDADRVGGGVSERLFEAGICLPSSSSLAEADQRRVVEATRRAIEAPAVAAEPPTG